MDNEYLIGAIGVMLLADTNSDKSIMTLFRTITFKTQYI